MFKISKFFQANSLIPLFQCFLFSLFAKEDIRYEIARGADIIRYFPEIIKISDVCYSEYPYLYEGSQSDEDFYMQFYANWPDSWLAVAYDNDRAIGYIIGTPVKNIPIGHEPLRLNGYPIDSLFLLGEIALLKPYRGELIGQEMVKQMESYVKDELKFPSICLTLIDESTVAMPKPGNYRSSHWFWNEQGYKPIPHSTFNIDWKNIGEDQKSPHTMYYWIKIF